jgi:hypothetical protein
MDPLCRPAPLVRETGHHGSSALRETCGARAQDNRDAVFHLRRRHVIGRCPARGPFRTTLRGIYVAERDCDATGATCKRDAFVDLSPEARTKHTGGALDELFSIYAIVDAITVNLPAISRVQILVDGKEVDTLAGHVDLRRPLEKNLKWVKTEKEG